MSESEVDVDVDGPTSRRGSYSVYSEHPVPRISRRSTMSGDVINPANLVSPELKQQMAKVFDAYLQRICSNLEATDAKGEAIHQTLMPKKMAKMDESLDFRPFKFRIAAFTNGFMEELAQHHLGEDVIPQKKIKAYLWHQQPYISRFNEDGKKSKSKGNHVWHIFARKEPNGTGWVFRAFERKIVGNPAPIAYVGLKWAWQPRIWDPQMSRQSIAVVWSSPALPPWLSWHKDLLIGVPGPGDATDVDIEIEASFPNEDRESIRSSFHVQVAPFTISEQIMASKPRRQSLAGDPSDPRRITGDTVGSQTVRSAPRGSNSPPAMNSINFDSSQILRVVTEASQNVAQAQSQANVSPHGGGNAVQVQRQVALAKQRQVLIMTIEAVNIGMLDTRNSETPAASTLAHAARDVVSEVARQIVLERVTRMPDARSNASAEMKAGPLAFHSSPPLSIKEVAAGLQTSVAHAVNHSDAMSSELEVMMTACALIKQQGQGGFASQSSGPMINPIPANAGVRLEDVIMPTPSQELSLGPTQVP
ncbi:hypothetical protein BS47DRAFT_634566 [Hydnum rufescens UP504]|uniref:Uncharacterized protein n=1 Tax=Hydnum rufescens UP504 TaxID=1448309 RepID=A0A9P6BAW3_9AGAM|nr:hypothetical protein BS47DRAFT_634566 [Hydnum rufescens UP504]